MKFVRYGKAGSEKPGLIGEDGKIRDLSGHVSDLSGKTLSPSSLKKLGKLKDLPAVKGNPRLGPCVAGTGKFICIGLNYSDHAAETGATVPPEPIIFMKATSAIVRTERRRPDPARFEEDRLGGRTRHRHRQDGEICLRGRGAGPCRRLLRHQRRLRTRLPDRALRPVDQGQELRHLRPDRPVARHQGRGRRPQPEDVADRQRQDRQDGSTATMVYGVAILVLLSEPVHEPASRRHHLDRHAARRRHGDEAAEVPQGRHMSS
jgi:hypothetical protein